MMPSPRFCLGFLCLVLWTSALASASNTTNTTETLAPGGANATSNATLTPTPTPQRTPKPTPAPTLPGCEECAVTGNCSRAMNGFGGKYCGKFSNAKKTSQQFCCCKYYDLCNLSDTACNCAVDESLNNGPSDGATDTQIILILVGLFVAAVLAIVFCCCVCRTTVDRMHDPNAPRLQPRGVLTRKVFASS